MKRKVRKLERQLGILSVAAYIMCSFVVLMSSASSWLLPSDWLFMQALKCAEGLALVLMAAVISAVCAIDFFTALLVKWIDDM